MTRTSAAAVTAVGLVLALVGCSRARATPPPPQAPSPIAAPATAAPSPTVVPTPTPAGPLPAVIARITFSLGGGDAYQPLSATTDQAGRVVVLCQQDGRPGATGSALVLLDAHGARRAIWGLPGRSLGPVAASNGQAYLAYEDSQHRPHLAAVDLETGVVLANVPIEHLYYSDTIIADAAGRVFLPLRDRLEVRDGVTLQVVRTLPYGAAARERAFVADLARGRLYLATDERLRAYRLPDLRLLWEAGGLSGRTQLVADSAGRRVYARGEVYEGGTLVTRVLPFDAASGQPLAPIPAPAGTGWQLVAADSQAGYLYLAEPRSQGTRIWQARPDGQPTGVEVRLPGWATFHAGPPGRLLALLPTDHLVRVLNLVDLQRVSEVATGIEIRNLVADPGRERLFLNDSAGRLHVVDTRQDRLQASLAVGSGPLALDAANNLLFASREPNGREVAVVDTVALTITATISGGDKVAVDSAGRRAFVGWTAPGLDPPPGEVQVWDTRTFRRLGAIAQRGEPTFNPLRNEIYLRDYSAYIVDGTTLAVTGELTPEIGAAPIKWCNGCVSVGNITVDPALDLIAVSRFTHATGGGPGTLLHPLLFSARTRQPVTRTATVLSRCGSVRPFIIPADGGLVYQAARFRRYVAYEGVIAYQAGSNQVVASREGLSLDLYLPGAGVALAAQGPYLLAYDVRRWEPLGWLPYQCIGEMDLAARRLYAWERAELTILAFDGGLPLPAEPPERLPIGRLAGPVQEIIISPAFERDRTVLAIAGGQVLRSTDGGARWSLLRGGLPRALPGRSATYRLALSPAFERDRTLFAAGWVGEPIGLGVWRSTDGGDRWTPAWSGLEHLRVDRLAVSPRFAEDRTLLAYSQYTEFWRAASGTTLFRSSDGGASWSKLATRPTSGDPPPLPRPEELLPLAVATVQFRPTDMGDGVLRSTDGGRTWQAVLQRGPGARLLAVAPSPFYESDRQAFALFQDQLYRSTDGGSAWQVAGDRHLVRADYTQHFTALAVGRLDAGRTVVFVGDAAGVILPLDPRQLRWNPVPSATPTGVAAIPTPAAQANPTPCPPAAPPFAGAYGRWAARLGCPTGPAAAAQMAGQRFERGLMLWRADTREAYVLSDQAGANRWAAYPDSWQEGQPDRDPTLQPPPGREQPVRGFGQVWRQQLGGPQANVGWASEPEAGYRGHVQPFAGGLLLVGPEGRVYALFADGAWEAQ